MKATTHAHLPIEGVLHAAARPRILQRPAVCTASVALGLAGTVFTAVLLLLTAWAASQGKADALGVLSWMSGLVLLALGIDGDDWQANWHILGGTVLLTMGWLASRVAPEFALISALVLGAVIAEALWQIRLKWSGRGLQGEVTKHQPFLAGGDSPEIA